MSRTDTALKPLVENNSSAAHRIASRKLGLRVEASSLSDWPVIFSWTNVQNNRSRQQISGVPAGRHRERASQAPSRLFQPRQRRACGLGKPNLKQGMTTPVINRYKRQILMESRFKAGH